MEKNKLSYEMKNFIRPIYTEKMNKGLPLFLCFINGVAALMIWDQQKSTMSMIYAIAGILLAIGGLFIIKADKRWIQKNLYGFFESVFLLIWAYLVTYMEYGAARYDVSPYILYTQLIGAGIFITFTYLFLYRLKNPAKDMNRKQMEKGISLGLMTGVGLIVLIFGGLLVLYFTVFKRNMHLIESSKMLYVAMGMNVLVAYYFLKVFYCIKYRSELKAIHIQKR